MKSINFYIESGDKKISTNEIILELKEQWKNTGKRIKDMKSVNIYFNTDETCAYCLINDSETIKIQK
ncbi:DUF6465 family protein [Clostridium grantii]|uniref:Uncharacterized protein n=1 Tax=Clostridium grantii DSM 8605 TaxID=1121316 RepID=A0A1M5QJ14_9CLOT|nr:DUF6465 family protein [Clostridium grantii]SHH13958.1 hypothetical protein SAMN02745207_00123 [Clostridium grantii DSM 8605]